MIRGKRIKGGVHLAHHKNTQDKPAIQISVPEKITIPMLQHIGASCEPLVNVGDEVFVGQLIGKTDKLSAPIHSSCSGKVISIEPYRTIQGVATKAIVIETDGKQTVYPNIQKPIVNSLETFVEAVKQSGLVGLGGAGFPTYVKLSYKDIDKIKTLVINAAECEPFITADYQESLSYTSHIVNGIELMKKYIGINSVYIGVESNKPKAIEHLVNVFKDDDNIKIVKLESLYPQGAERVIIRSVSGLEVPKGMLPADCGIIVLNVSTVAFISKYIENGMPLTSRTVTVDGDIVENPNNFNVLVGTSVRHILECLKLEDTYAKVLLGGPMMGLAIKDIDMPIVKNTNAITVLSQKAAKSDVTSACIRCARCIRACPIGLKPVMLERAFDNKDVDLLQKLDIDLCMLCGCCSYVCPAKRYLTQKHQLAKKLVQKAKSK